MSAPRKRVFPGGNLFEFSRDLIRSIEKGDPLEKEFIEPLLPDRGVLVERIVSFGQSSPPGFWYDQERDEWVALLSGEAVLEWEDGGVLEVHPGDWIFLHAHERHRVARTSSEPPCVWLAVHGRMRG
ncbi:cupin domain-containing protein [Aminiphilus circumscriptus]|uniref:cupin domain-containing protein n=1 Tax=Aminiphilus circumscriptus TaxID=290732 RepID=UPI0004BAF612|nr:cupin domain-containing protein [Aminiphilus circumscriptus]